MGCSTSVTSVDTDYSENFHCQYKIGRKLGDGAFGQVRVASDKLGAESAVKVVDVRLRDKQGGCTGEVDRKRLRLARNEVMLWRELGRHAHCVRLDSVFCEQSVFYMVMELCRCPLIDGLAEVPVVTEADLGNIFRQMCLGIHHLHEHGLVHRDIKPDHFLLGGASIELVKLCDFGLATRMPKLGMLRGVYGTVPYMSPEMLSGNGYDQRTDIWSLGATVHQILYGCYLYSPVLKTMDAMKKAILEDCPTLTLPETWNSLGKAGRLPAGAVDFLSSLLQRRPAARCPVDQAANHPFLRQGGASTPVSCAVRAACGRAPEGANVEATSQLFPAQHGISLPLCLSEGPEDRECAVQACPCHFADVKKGNTPVQACHTESTRMGESAVWSERPSLGSPVFAQ